MDRSSGPEGGTEDLTAFSGPSFQQWRSQVVEEDPRDDYEGVRFLPRSEARHDERKFQAEMARLTGSLRSYFIPYGDSRFGWITASETSDEEEIIPDWAKYIRSPRFIWKSESPQRKLLEGSEARSSSPEPVCQEAAVEDRAEAEIVETSEALVEDTCEAQVKNTSETLVEETSEALVEDTTEALVEETSETLVEDTSETLVEDTSEAQVEDTSEAQFDLEEEVPPKPEEGDKDGGKEEKEDLGERKTAGPSEGGKKKKKKRRHCIAKEPEKVEEPIPTLPNLKGPVLYIERMREREDPRNIAKICLTCRIQAALFDLRQGLEEEPHLLFERDKCGYRNWQMIPSDHDLTLADQVLPAGTDIESREEQLQGRLDFITDEVKQRKLAKERLQDIISELQAMLREPDVEVERGQVGAAGFENELRDNRNGEERPKLGGEAQTIRMSPAEGLPDSGERSLESAAAAASEQDTKGLDWSLADDQKPLGEPLPEPREEKGRETPEQGLQEKRPLINWAQFKSYNKNTPPEGNQKEQAKLYLKCRENTNRPDLEWEPKEDPLFLMVPNKDGQMRWEIVEAENDRDVKVKKRRPRRRNNKGKVQYRTVLLEQQDTNSEEGKDKTEELMGIEEPSEPGPSGTCQRSPAPPPQRPSNLRHADDQPRGRRFSRGGRGKWHWDSTYKPR